METKCRSIGINAAAAALGTTPVLLDRKGEGDARMTLWRVGAECWIETNGDPIGPIGPDPDEEDVLHLIIDSGWWRHIVLTDARMSLIADYAAPPSADYFQSVPVDEIRATVAEIRADQTYVDQAEKDSDLSDAESALALAEAGQQVLRATDEDGDYYAVADPQAPLTPAPAAVVIIIRDSFSKRVVPAAEAEAAIRGWYGKGYDFGDGEAPALADREAAIASVEFDGDLESLAIDVTDVIWKLLGKPVDWCSYWGLGVEIV